MRRSTVLSWELIQRIEANPRPPYDELAVRRERRALERMEAARRAWLSGHPSAGSLLTAVDVAALVEDR